MAPGFGTPIDPDRDTSTAVIWIAPVAETPTYCYTYLNCSTNWYSVPTRSDEEQKKAWRAYWQGFYEKKSTRYALLRNQISRSAPFIARKIPCLAQQRKKALSPAVHAHHRFMAKMMRPVRQLV